MSPHPSTNTPSQCHSTDPAAEQARAWIAWLASGDGDAGRMAAFEHWLAMPGHRHAFERERTLWRSLGPRPQTQTPVRRSMRRRGRLGWITSAAAAALLIVITGPELWLRVQADHRSGHAVQSITLPDGSRAVLDADSAIAVHDSGAVRRIDLLQGRVWFEVAPAPGRRFEVHAGGGVVEDISTAFVVATNGTAVDARVEQGRVRVSAAPGRGWTYLQTGQRARFAPAGEVERMPDVPLDRMAAWRHGELLLEATPVEQAVEEIGRYRAGPTLVRGDLSRLPPVDAAFHLSDPDSALDALAASVGLQVTRLPLGVAIVSAAR